MIDMHIENYHITTDARNYVVTYTHEKDGKTIEGAARFYNSLPLAFQAIAKDMLKKGEGAITTIDAYVERARKIDTMLAAAALDYGQKIREIAQHEN